jgi:YD repeat-containing protein
MTRRFDVGGAPGARPRLDGREVATGPVQLYRRTVRGAVVCGLWLAGRPVFDVEVFDPAGRPLGTIEPEGEQARRTYDDLRRALVAEEIRA